MTEREALREHLNAKLVQFCNGDERHLAETALRLLDELEASPSKEALITRSLEDPFTMLISKMWCDAWAYGYRECLRDHHYEPTESHSDLMNRATRALTAQTPSADEVLALAKLAPLHGVPKL